MLLAATSTSWQSFSATHVEVIQECLSVVVISSYSHIQAIVYYSTNRNVHKISLTWYEYNFNNTQSLGVLSGKTTLAIVPCNVNVQIPSVKNIYASLDNHIYKNNLSRNCDELQVQIMKTHHWFTLAKGGGRKTNYYTVVVTHCLLPIFVPCWGMSIKTHLQAICHIQVP